MYRIRTFKVDENVCLHFAATITMNGNMLVLVYMHGRNFPPEKGPLLLE
jgi:hypothetical protein